MHPTTTQYNSLFATRDFYDMLLYIGVCVVKVQQVNNNSTNVSHQAYFKPNKIFKEMCKENNIACVRKETLENFTKVLPNHQLEIHEYYKTGPSFFFNIFNNNTFQWRRIYVNSLTNHFCSLMAALLEDNAKNQYFFQEDALATKNYNKMATPRITV